MSKSVKAAKENRCGDKAHPGPGCPNPCEQEHECPFASEIHDDHETMCCCCEDCAHECAMEV